MSAKRAHVRYATIGFSFFSIAEMDLDHGSGDGSYGVRNCYRSMSIGSGIADDAIQGISPLVQLINKHAFMVTLLEWKKNGWKLVSQSK